MNKGSLSPGGHYRILRPEWISGHIEPSAIYDRATMAFYSRPLAVWRTVRTCRIFWETSGVQRQAENTSSSKRALHEVGLGLAGTRWARGMATTTALRVFIVAGEPSGDAIGSRLMASLRCLSSGPLEFAGVGGYWFLSVASSGFDAKCVSKHLVKRTRVRVYGSGEDSISNCFEGGWTLMWMTFNVQSIWSDGRLG